MFLWNDTVEVIEATEAVEAVKVIEATEILRPGKSLLSTLELSRFLNLALFWCFENNFFSGIMKCHFSSFAHFLLEAVEASLGYFFENWCPWTFSIINKEASWNPPESFKKFQGRNPYNIFVAILENQCPHKFIQSKGEFEMP